MYIDYSTWETFDYKVTSLQLDVNNPRIRYSKENLNQTQILKLLIEKEKIYDLAKKISEEGYFIGEEPIICIENGKKVVLEGNRRIASLKLLQDPKKYLTVTKANVLLQNILKNNIPVDEYKIKCHIAPNRLLANPIIYSRHKGDAVKRWETGNQYSFVAEMYYQDALDVDDICDVLNETRGNILKTIKLYNLFREGQSLLEKEGFHIDSSNFNLTNLERLYNVDDARQFFGITFDNDNGEIIRMLPEEEYEKRILLVFKELVNSESFSREYNTSEELKSFVKKLTDSPEIDMSVALVNRGNTKNTSSNRIDLEIAKKNITKRRMSKKSLYDNNVIIPRDKELFFDHEKLDALFTELKGLPVNKKYSFSVLLRTYLEQSLYYFLDQNQLLEEFSEKTNEDIKQKGLLKVRNLIKYLNGKHSIDSQSICEEEVMRILKFNPDKKDFSNVSLKPMLDFILNKVLHEHLDNQTFKVVKQQIDLIKTSLDLSVHNIKYFADIETTKKAWNDLEPLLDYLCNNINSKK